MNIGYENYRYFTPYHVFNPYKDMIKGNFILDSNKDISKYYFSQIGYQIMNPQFISYHLEPIYSSLPSSSKSKISSIEIGKPVFDSNSNNNLLSYDNIRYNNYSKIFHKDDYDYRSSNIKSPFDKRSYFLSTKDKTKSQSKSPNHDESFPKFNTKLKESVTPFIHLLKDSKMNSMKTNVKRRTKEEWFKLFRSFINIYVFLSSAKKYSCVQGNLRNKLINERIKNVVNDIAILKDWIISMEETFFDKFKNYEEFNGELITQGEKNKRTKKNILNNIKIFINNLKSNLEEIPDNVQNILYKYIKDNSYFPKKYLSKFEINRIDFNFYGETKHLSKMESAMILSYLIINGVTIQQILLHIKDVFTEYSNCYNIEKAAINIGSVLHNLVKNLFKKKLKLKNDILALFNYYRNYHLFDEKIEKLKDKINDKVIIEENDNEDEYNKNLLRLNDINKLLDENEKISEEFMDKIYEWAIKLAKNLRNKFFSSKDINIINKNSKTYNIKSKIINVD